MNKYIQQIQEYLNKEEIHTRFIEEEQRFESLFSGNHVDVYSRICYIEEDQKLEHIVILDAKVPEERNGEICILLNIINNSMTVGQFILTNRGYVVCTTRFYTNDDASLTAGQLKRFWHSPLNMVIDFERTIMSVAFGDIDARTAMDRLWEEREAARKALVKAPRPSIRETIKKWVKGIGRN